ncbi:hypothetical protein [Actinoplanes sp. NPDC026670]|uniref:hypothetical protein n=1 Tax=Actinoplanes sp. NPDC026670 TaxID=3154700 RepID=UPI0033EF83DC
MQEPTDFLVPPVEPDESLTNGFIDPGFLFNYVSPTSWINEIINVVTEFDVLGFLTEAIGGDWSTIWRFGDAMRNVGECVGQIAVNLQQDFNRIDETWDGNANDAAAGYFTTMASTVAQMRFTLLEIGESYHTAAKGAWGFATQLANLLQALVDKAIIAGILGIGTAVLYSSGVGAGAGFVGSSAVALIIADMINLASSASLIISTASTVIMGGFGVVMSAVYQGGDLSGIQLPSAPYAVPGA